MSERQVTVPGPVSAGSIRMVRAPGTTVGSAPETVPVVSLLGINFNFLDENPVTDDQITCSISANANNSDHSITATFLFEVDGVQTAVLPVGFAMFIKTISNLSISYIDITPINNARLKISNLNLVSNIYPELGHGTSVGLRYELLDKNGEYVSGGGPGTERFIGINFIT